MNKLSDNELVKDTAYSKENAENYDNYRFTDRSGKLIHDVEWSKLDEVLTTLPAGSRVLEVGCGTGRIMVEVANHNFLIDGADASGPMLAEAEAKFVHSEHEKPKLLLCEAADIPCEDHSYDMVYSIRLLNQTESPEYALRVVEEIVRITKPGGVCLIEFINTYRPRVGLNKRSTTRLRPQEVRSRTEKAGADFVSWKGAFFVGMATYKSVPNSILTIVSKVDSVLASMFPRLCSRVYIHIKKRKS